MLLVLLAATIASAQTTPSAPLPQPPKDVDSALRARVAAFYTLLVKHDYRRAEEFVAPDTRDSYYEREKPRYLSFEVTSVKWSQDFTSAEVVMKVLMPGFMPENPKPMEEPVKGVWRLIDGGWYWAPPKVTVTDLVKSMYGVDPDAKSEGGLFRVGAGSSPADLSPAAAGPALPSSSVNLPGGMGRPEAMQMAASEGAPRGTLQVDRQNVEMTAPATAKVTLSNTSKASMTLFILGKLAGIETAFDHEAIKPGEKAVLTLKAGAGAQGGMLLIGVNETKEMISLPVTVK